MQKTYGKTQAELSTLVEGFAWALAGYPMDRVMKAMRQYVLANSDVPAPADIVRIMEGEKANVITLGVSS